ncbi:MAG: transposase domain-containing protein [Pseudonocardia sp.]|nr:transposase domain-containing protein [Pseudonocardia sp.]
MPTEPESYPSSQLLPAQTDFEIVLRAPSASAISQARTRLGEAPVKLLF